jgi:hypothetical protein
MLSVPEIHVRGIDASLLRAVNVEAAKQDLTQRDFIIQALAKAVGWEAIDMVPAVPVGSKLVDCATPIPSAAGNRQVAVKHAGNCRCYVCKPPKNL